MFTSLSPFSRTFLFVLLSSALITACNSSDTTTPSSGLDTGAVALLITDAPTSAYDEINVVAEQVSLIGEGSREAKLMNRSARFNLLDLRNTFCRLSKTRAPVGTYSKVRFQISDVELIKRDRDGNITERVIPRLERNMIDLNARTQFAVDRLRQLVVKLDLDADASLGTDPDTGDPVFDPDTTVEVDSVPTDTDAPPQEVTPLLMNEQGDVRNLLTDSFQLCNPDQVDDCVQVNTSPDTVVMNSSLAPVVSIGDIENTRVQVFGHLDVTTDTINALHVIQYSTRLNTYTGTLSGDVVNDQINLNITAGSEAGNTYPVTSVSLSGVYDSTGNVLDASALGNGVNVEVIGLLNGFAPFETLKPGVIILSNP
jgi:hypothetical protein